MISPIKINIGMGNNENFEMELNMLRVNWFSPELPFQRINTPKILIIRKENAMGKPIRKKKERPKKIIRRTSHHSIINPPYLLLTVDMF
jgi:hypothetical protein